MDERESNGASLRGTTQHAADKNHIFQLNPEQQRPVLRQVSDKRVFLCFRQFTRRGVEVRVEYSTVKH